MTEAYELLQQEYIADVQAQAYLLKHKKSGARVAVLSCDDDNKVFNIAFRTPPKNSTGVAHIIEHTVLCGSRKFPLKDPFVELAKGSLNTFLNAMTYPDKTMYPVGSCNDVDFKNLMEVYLDAVFYPNIYHEEKIFRQEGWHIHLEDRNDPLVYNGVVYNEMKGVFSTPDEILQRTVFNTLFPDTPYGVESGGDPLVIPELSYEEFLDFHRTYYHPSNSYIYLYGNMDTEERLSWLDREYLSHFDRIEVDSVISCQEPFARPVEVTEEYPILDGESEEEKTYLSWNTVVGDVMDVTQTIAFSILEYVLLDAPGAPVKQALLDAHIGKDIEGFYEDGIRQPFFSVIARQAEETDKERFLDVIRGTLEKLASDGLDRRALASGINYLEFRFREADYASFPKGLIYGIDLFDSWLYDDARPFAYLHELAVFDDLKKKAEEGYFEELIRRELLGNTHQSVVILRPKKGLAAQREEEAARRMAEYKAQLSGEELDRIVAETEALQAYQEEEDPPEAVRTIPLLARTDIAKEIPVHISAEKTETGGICCLKHRYATNGIGYLTLLFDTKDVPEELIPYLGLLKGVLGQISTEHYSYGDLFHEINANSGGITFGLSVYPVRKGEQGDTGYKMMGVRAKYLYPQQAFVFRMIREILTASKLEDTKRLREILDSGIAGMQHSLQAAGHATAATRAMAVRSELAAWTDATSGIGAYRFMEKLGAEYEERREEIVGSLQKLMQIVFRPENMLVSLTADGDGFEGLEEQAAELAAALSVLTDGSSRDGFWRGSSRTPVLSEPCELSTAAFELEAKASRKDPSLDEPSCRNMTAQDIHSAACRTEYRLRAEKNEAFKTSGQVQYVALAGNFREAGLPYTGRLRVLKTILSYDYLWMNIRVLGGAYGCMTAMKRSGDTYLVSYRDPHLKETLDVYRALPDWLKELELDDRAMTKYIIGAVSEMDHPMNASAKGSFALLAYLAGLTDDDLQAERDEVLSAEPEGIRALSAYMQAVIDTGSVCVIGSESAVEENAGSFENVEALITV